MKRNLTNKRGKEASTEPTHAYPNETDTHVVEEKSGNNKTVKRKKKKLKNKERRKKKQTWARPRLPTS